MSSDANEFNEQVAQVRAMLLETEKMQHKIDEARKIMAAYIEAQGVPEDPYEIVSRLSNDFGLSAGKAFRMYDAERDNVEVTHILRNHPVTLDLLSFAKIDYHFDDDDPNLVFCKTPSDATEEERIAYFTNAMHLVYKTKTYGVRHVAFHNVYKVVGDRNVSEFVVMREFCKAKGYKSFRPTQAYGGTRVFEVLKKEDEEVASSPWIGV